MRNLVARGLIIGIALLLLGGCATLRLGYNNGPTLAWWWLDRYAGFSREQAPLVREGINTWFDWHRSSQLEGYAALLAQAQRDILRPTTPAAVCAWQDRVQALVDPAVERAVQVAAPLLPRLEAGNLERIAQRQARRLEELRREHLQPDEAERRRAAVQRTAERYQRVYGRLSAEQRSLLADALAEAPLDPERWLAERERRQQAVLEGLRAASAPGLGAEARKTALRALTTPVAGEDPAAQARQQRVTAFQCAMTARLHNSTTPAQRERAQRTLRGWEDDLRSLAGSGA